MTTPPATLLAALESADMLEVDGLHAWQFSLDTELLAQLSAGSADADSPQQTLLSIECMDGRVARRWQFSLAAVQAASFDAATDSWSLENDQATHQLKCFSAISADNSTADSANDTDSPLVP
jgi:hypothetical protein